MNAAQKEILYTKLGYKIEYTQELLPTHTEFGITYEPLDLPYLCDENGKPVGTAFNSIEDLWENCPIITGWLTRSFLKNRQAIINIQYTSDKIEITIHEGDRIITGSTLENEAKLLAELIYENFIN